MQRTKKATRTRTGWRTRWAAAVAMLAVAGLSVAPARGSEMMEHFSFVNNCESGFTCTGEPGSRVCWCEMDWDDTGFWQMCWGVSWGSCGDEDPPVSFPDQSTANELLEHVIIEHSTTDSRCDGGIDHASTCNSDSQCHKTCDNPEGAWDGSNCETSRIATYCVNAGGTCKDHDCEPEQYLLINLTEDGSSNSITITTFELKSESSGSLDIRFESKDASNDLTALRVTIDGTNGDVEMRVSDSAELNTQ